MWGYGNEAADAVRHRRAADLQSQIESSRTRRASDDVEDRLDRHVLLTEAMWELLAERLGLTSADLAAKVLEIDGRSGAVNGKREVAPARRCPSCDAAVTVGARTCQFCGEPMDGHDPFAV
ncbi:MAG: hypothetical protein R2699_01640 [Acidimicrobiales bacterium]|nr:hypothetical protein [Acidimicrobiales bacterium]MCB1247958.1 hypothetical protein [Acidimicrobiales bacterium]MCB1262043.1 hypothetical protein [Acidimicrobiales bacterium]